MNLLLNKVITATILSTLNSNSIINNRRQRPNQVMRLILPRIGSNTLNGVFLEDRPGPESTEIRVERIRPCQLERMEERQPCLLQHQLISLLPRSPLVPIV